MQGICPRCGAGSLSVYTLIFIFLAFAIDTQMLLFWRRPFPVPTEGTNSSKLIESILSGLSVVVHLGPVNAVYHF